MAKISPFGLKIGLPINLDLNDGQNKYKVHIFKVVAKITNIWPKIGQVPLWAQGLQMGITRPFLSDSKVLGQQNNAFFKTNRMVLRTKLYLL